MKNEFRDIQEAYQQIDESTYSVVANELIRLKKKFDRVLNDGQPELEMLQAFIDIAGNMSQGKSFNEPIENLKWLAINKKGK